MTDARPPGGRARVGAEAVANGDAALGSDRVRIWQLASAAGLSTKQTRDRLDMLGWPTTSHASTVPTNVAQHFLEVVKPLPAPEPVRDAGNPHWRLLKYVRAHTRGWVMIVATTLTSSIVALANPWPLKVLADDVLTRRRPPAALEWLVGDQLSLTIALLAVAGFLAFAVGMVFEVVLARLWIRVGQRMVLDIAGDILRQLQRQSLSFHGRAPVGDSISRIMVDSYGLGELLNTLLFTPFQALALTVFTISLLLSLDPLLTVAAVVVAVTMTVVSRLYGRAIRAAARVNRDASSSLQTHVHHVLTGLPVVQAFGQEAREHGMFQRLANAAIASQKRSMLLRSLNGLGSGFAGAVGGGVVLWFGASRVLDGKLTVGSLLVFLSYLTTLRAQAGVLARLYPSVQQSRAAVDRILEVLEAEPDVADRPGARDLEEVRGRVAFEGVSFSYVAGRRVLRDVSFEVLPGQTVALVGPSGAGKTTLASLLPRFYDPEEGRVLLDGHDLRDVTLASLRRQVSLVLQEPFLFPISVAENIAYGRPWATREEVVAAAKAANAHDFVMELPDGYDTVVGERGGTLSGGQRQRVSIARALLKDAPLLVLDEPTSALDTESERLLLGALKRLMVGRTTFIIAHRLSTIRDADLILVMDNGRIIERGTHAELRAAGGMYSKLVGAARRSSRRGQGVVVG